MPVSQPSACSATTEIAYLVGSGARADLEYDQAFADFQLTQNSTIRASGS
jgi:hypothetical protein